MDEHVLRIFKHEVERQCKFSLMAWQDLGRALEERDLDRLWYSVQAFLVAAGNISKLLWPSSSQGLIPERGEQLRSSLSVSEDSVLRLRTFRNRFEHFDERLEQWTMSSKRRNFVDSNVGSPGSIVGVDPGDFLRNFDTENFAVTFRGDHYPLRPIAEAIEELWSAARR